MIFIQKDTFFLESDQPKLEGMENYYMINDYLGYFPYDTLQQVEQEVNRLKMHDGIRIGLSRSKRVERLIDINTFETRFSERETVNFIQNGKLVSHLQPIIHMDSQKVYGYESLLRASNPEEFISPGKLFQIASQTGLHSLLDQRAREEAVKSREGRIVPGLKSFI